MDYQGALKFLGLSDSASSEDMVRAKNQMMSRYREEEDKLKKVSHVAKRRAMTRRDGAFSTLASAGPTVPRRHTRF